MNKTRTADNSFVRELNLSVILYATRDYAPLSRAQLAVKTGLNKTTVSSLVSLTYEFFMPPILRVIEEITLPWSSRGTKIIAAVHGSDACVMGGVATVYDRVLAEPKVLSSRFGER